MKLNRLRQAALAVAVSVSVTSSFGLIADVRAQTTPAASTCMSLLTAEELTKAVGLAMTDAGSESRSAGTTECPWMSRGPAGVKTVFVEFFELRMIKGSPTANTLAAFFEQIVSAGEGAATGKREMLPGIGQRAAFVPTDPQVLAVVQRADGVARIVGNGLTKAQIVAVARAVATP